MEQAPTCRRCGRIAVGWALARPDACSESRWSHCIREPEVVSAENANAEKDRPGDTVLRVSSQRAGQRLASALGRKPQRYSRKTLRHGGVFVVLASDELESALKVKGVGRTRLKVEDVARWD